MVATFSSNQVLNGLAKLKAVKDKNKHRHTTFKVYDDNGILLGATHISHGGGDIDDTLLLLMARELKITQSLWKKIIGCTKSRSEYIDEAGS